MKLLKNRASVQSLSKRWTN